MRTLQIGITEPTLNRIFAVLQQRFRPRYQGEIALFDKVSLAYDIGVHAENGALQLRPGGLVHIKDMEIVFDPLALDLIVDLPDVTVGGQCLVKIAGSCVVRLPKISLFEGHRDIVVPVRLSGLRCRLSISGQFRSGLVRNPNRPPYISDHAAHDMGVADHREITIQAHPAGFNFEPLDLGGIAGDLMNRLIDLAVDGVLGGLPGWAKAAIRSILGPLANLVRSLLRLPSDGRRWLEDRLLIDLDLFNWLAKQLIASLDTEQALAAIEEPYPLLEAVQQPPLNAVLVKTDRLELSTDDHPGELVLISTLSSYP